LNSINKIICDMITDAVQKINDTSGRDITYPCIVTKIYSDENTYQLSYKNSNYVVKLSNISLKLYDTVHLVLPQGNFKDKYVLEDICCKYSKE